MVCLVANKAESRIAGYYDYSNITYNDISPNQPLDRPICIECKLLRHVVMSDVEAEIAGLFVNCQKVFKIKQLLDALSHPQGTSLVKTDNSTAVSIVTNIIK